MAAPLKSPNTQTTSQQKSEELQRDLAAHAAARSLDTFEAAAEVAVSPVTRDALGGTRVETNAPGFGQTDSTDFTGEAAPDQDLSEATGNLENDELAEGQAALTDYQSTKEEQVSSVAPPDDPNFKTPVIDNPADRLSGGGAGATESAGGGGAENRSGSDIVANGAFPDGVTTGADAVAAANGPGTDSSQLIGEPRDLVQKGGGDSVAADSDALHDALSAVVNERADTTTSKTSVADDTTDAAVGTVVAVAAATAANAIVAAAEVVGGISVAGAAAVTGLGVLAVGGAGIAGYAVGSAVEEDFSDAIHGVETQSQTEYKAMLGRLDGANRKQAKGGGAGDPGSPDEDRHGPITESEKALRRATDKILGRDDALVHGPATQINPGDQGETFQRGTGALPDPQATKEALIGQPKEEGGRPSGGEAGEPGFGQGPDHGGDIDFEDGSGFTGEIRHQGPEDVQFGRDEPLLGLGGASDDDALPPKDDDSDDDRVGKASIFSIFDDD